MFFLLLMGSGFVLAATGTYASGFQDAQFGAGILLWFVGVFGAVYCIVSRLAGPKVAKFAVLALFLILLSELIFGKHDKKNHNRFDRTS